MDSSAEKLSRPGVLLRKIWEDSDLLELRVSVSDGASTFVNQVYLGHGALGEVVQELESFRPQLSGGLLDVRFGDFGPEWASVAFHGRFQMLPPGRVYVSARQESGYRDFADKSVADSANLHLISEPGLLDLLVAELAQLVRGERVEARLEGIGSA